MAGLKISLLGGMEIRPASGDGEVSVTRKTGAILAYLALQDGHVQSRDKLAGLFWSRNTDEQARMNLRQALSRLRKALLNGGQTPLRTDADRIALDPELVDLDVTRFETLLQQGRTDALEKALSLYRGDLLDGMTLNEEGFEHWLREERERLRSLAIDAMATLSSRYEESRDLDRCIMVTSRLLAFDPIRESAHRNLMRAFAAGGRHAMALRQYQTCADTLRRELGVEPDAKTQALFREILQRRRTDDDSAGMERAMTTAEELQGPGAVTLKLPDRPSVAVLPFENKSKDTSQDYFVDGITENVIVGLSRFRDLFVIAPKTAFLARELAGDPREAGARLGVAHILEGSVRRSEDRLRVTVQLSEAATGRRIWAEQYDRKLRDVFAIQDEVAGRIVTSLVGRIETETRHAAERKAIPDMTAFDYLLRARVRLNSYSKDGVAEARQLLNDALKIDPDLAAAWSELARSFLVEYESVWSEDPDIALEKAQELAKKAIDLDRDDPVSRYSLAGVHLYLNRHDLAALEIDRALELNPNDYHNLCQKGWILAFSGRLDESVTCSLEAMRTSPFAPDNCLLSNGMVEYSKRQYGAATGLLERIRGGNVWRDVYLAASLAQMGRIDEARKHATELMSAVSRESGRERGAGTTSWRRYWERWFHHSSPEEFGHLMEGLRKAGMPV